MLVVATCEDPVSVGEGGWDEEEDEDIGTNTGIKVLLRLKQQAGVVPDVPMDVPPPRHNVPLADFLLKEAKRTRGSNLRHMLLRVRGWACNEAGKRIAFNHPNAIKAWPSQLND